MNSVDYKSNSNKSKERRNTEERKKLDKVVRGTVKTRKKSELRKFTDIFVAEDIHSVGRFIMSDLVIPTIKKVAVDIISEGAHMFFLGDSGRGRPSSSASYISYRSYSDKGNRDRFSEPRSRTGYSYDDIILDSRGEAEEVLSRMDELIDTYGMVSIADLYDLIGKSSNYTDNNYGWKNIRNAEAVRCRDGGYMLRLPKALPL